MVAVSYRITDLHIIYIIARLVNVVMVAVSISIGWYPE